VLNFVGLRGCLFAAVAQIFGKTQYFGRYGGGLNDQSPSDRGRLPRRASRLCGFQKRRVDRRESIIPSARKADAPSTPQFSNGEGELELRRVHKKLAEAHYFLRLIRDQEPRIGGDENPFDFLLSAFLSAARSVDYRLRHEHKATYKPWRKT
jgi:hypothetical protein